MVDRLRSISINACTNYTQTPEYTIEVDKLSEFVDKILQNEGRFAEKRSFFLDCWSVASFDGED